MNISPQWHLGLLYCKFHIFIGRLCDTFSVYSMMFMAVSRYSVISNAAGRGISVRNTYKLVLVCIMVAILSAVPEAISFTTLNLADRMPQQFPSYGLHTTV